MIMKKQSKYGMPPIESRQEFERNMFLVLEDFNRKMDSGNDNLKANAYWATYPHLRRLRTLPNGRIDLLTIDESLRLQGNMSNWMRFMERPTRVEPDDANDNLDIKGSAQEMPP